MRRNRGLDCLRVLSAIAVVVIHCNAKYYFADGTEHGTISYCVSAIVNLITRFSVPCFILMSGKFNLSDNRNADASYFYRKSLPKILIPYLGIYLCWTVYSFISVIKTANLLLFAKSLVKGTNGNLWFMPMIIILYLLTPAFVQIKSRLSKGQDMQVGVLLLIWGIISQCTSEYTLPYSIGVVISYASYYWLGSVLTAYNVFKFRMMCVGGGYWHNDTHSGNSCI